MKEWQGVSEFVAVAEQGSFSAAARSLGISVAQVSRTIDQLEQRLNIKLVQRTTRQVRLTDNGQLYYQQCRPLVFGLQQANQLLQSLQHEPSGPVRLTAPVYYGETLIAPLLHEFLLRHPKLQLDLVLTNDQLDLVKGGFDAAIRLGQLTDSSLQARKLGSRRLFLAASPTYLQQHGTPQNLNELQHHQCLVGSLEVWRFEQQGQKLQIRPQPYLKCNSGVALTDACIKGLGITQLPDYYLKPFLDSGQLLSLLPDYQPTDDGIWALYPLTRHLPLKVRLLLDYLQQQLADAH
ncbi:LysR family transcriptional regulator [Rheinheimera marina]|uniref:LysR family transcriptional regulator n=1 Tax=Rheinheimera marina TaxID=1774958 RepID=A0ABV9JKC2_9GAMM